MSLADDDDAVF